MNGEEFFVTAFELDGELGLGIGGFESDGEAIFLNSVIFKINLVLAISGIFYNFYNDLGL